MKKSTLSEQVTILHAKLAMSQNRRDIIALSKEFGLLVDEVLKKENALPIGQDETTVSGTITFTKNEVSGMDKTFKKHFILNGYIAHLIKRKSGKRGVLYEIRYRRNGYDIETSSTDLAEAKRKFLEKTLPENIAQYYRGDGGTAQKIPTNFEQFSLYYFEKYRKRTVAQSTFKNDCSRLKSCLIPTFGRIELKKITPSSCQKLLDDLMEQGKAKTAVEAYNLLSCIFKNAIAHNLIPRNPLAIVLKPRYDQENGKAFTMEEERRLVSALYASKFGIILALALYCGLRPNELSTAEIDGDFIKAVNSKRHNKDKNIIEYKWIPITERLRPFIKNGIPPLPSLNAARKFLSNLFPNHILYDCRTTFYSRCKECGVDQRALNEFMGHSLGKIEKAYTDLSKEFLLQEGKKINY